MKVTIKLDDYYNALRWLISNTKTSLVERAYRSDEWCMEFPTTYLRGIPAIVVNIYNLEKAVEFALIFRIS